MAIYHLSVGIISRGKGKSAVAAAAYRAGEKLTNDYDGVTHNYTRKRGVLHTEIMLPEHAQPEFTDRSVLWNSVEKIEKANNSQLARSVEIALPKELTIEQNLQLIREYIKNNFVSVGMCADFAIHDQHDNNNNIHAHILLTTRPLKANWKWGEKEKKEYALDDNGERIPIIDPATGLQKVDSRNRKQWKRVYVEVNDWNNRGNVGMWRESWANICNEYLQKNNIAEKIDHRSYERQQLEVIPTIHLGAAATAMERRGIKTHLGDINRAIVKKNNLIQILKNQISKAKNAILNLIKSEDVPVDNNRKYDELKKSLTVKNARISELNKWLKAYNDYKKYKPVFDTLENLKQAKIKADNSLFGDRKLKNSPYGKCEYALMNYEDTNRGALMWYENALKALPKNWRKEYKSWRGELDKLVAEVSRDRAEIEELKRTFCKDEDKGIVARIRETPKVDREEFKRRKSSQELE